MFSRIPVQESFKQKCFSIFSKISSSDGVEEANNVRVIGKELVPWSNGLETEEQEVPHDVLVVMMQSIQAGDHVGHFQLFLGVLQQRDEGSLRALGQLVGAHTDVEPVLPEDCLPAGSGAAEACCREADLCGLVLTVLHSRVCILVSVGVLSIAHKVRGIAIVPRASALWELPTCAGNIKPAVEARRPSSWWRWS